MSSSAALPHSTPGTSAATQSPHITPAVRDVAYIALGSNLGDRAAHLAAARAALAALPGCRLIGESTIEETEPIGGPPQGRFLNQMLALETDLAPRALLAALQRIERIAGRERGERWGPRTLDLDIVCFASSRRVATDDLVVPHPALGQRHFWARELRELGAAS